MRRTTPEGAQVEYPVDPAQIAEALAAKVEFTTGILNSNTILVHSAGMRRTVVEYRPPQKTALFLEGSDAPITIPLPPLVMIRSTTANESPQYAIFAVKERPTLETWLYDAPLPNLYHNGGVCWGSVKKATAEALAGNDLSEDWQILLGSPFNGHSVHGKSKLFKRDIRQHYTALEARKARVYPKRDLIRTQHRLSDILERSKAP